MKNIPKICHLYWDRTPMSFVQSLTIDTFHKHNPDWKIIVYVPEKRYLGTRAYIPFYTGKDYFHLVENKSFVTIKTINLNDYHINENLHDILRSDILRYKLLYEYGGIWSDFDVIWIKPITHLYNLDYLQKENIDNMYGTVCMFLETTGYHNISVMIHSKKCPFIKSLIDKTDELQTNVELNSGHQSFGTTMLNGLYPKFSDVSSKFPNIIPLKYETIFPYSIFNMESLYSQQQTSYITNNVLCIHWFNGHQLSKDYMNGKNTNSNCTMSLILKNLI